MLPAQGPSESLTRHPLGKTALHLASEARHLAVVELLRAQANALDATGRCALHGLLHEFEATGATRRTCGSEMSCRDTFSKCTSTSQVSRVLGSSKTLYSLLAKPASTACTALWRACLLCAEASHPMA